MPIIERALYGRIKLETSPWSTPFVWTDRTADLVSGFNYSVGGRVGQPGSSPVDVGTLNATFKNMSSVPNVGALIRLSFTGVAGYAFVGYVQDVSQRIVFDDSVSYTTPVTLTTLNCVDWVGYVSQFQLVGVGGSNATTGAKLNTSGYYWPSRVASINKSLDATYATKIITSVSTTNGSEMGDSDTVATIPDHLDLISRTSQTYWYGNPVLPTNTTTGRTGLITMRSNASTVSSGKTFTDLVGSAGQLHYTEIDFQNSSQNVANVVVVNNQARFAVDEAEVTKVGGFNEENFVIVDGVETPGLSVTRTELASDTTSITTFGNRQIEITTNGVMRKLTVLNYLNLIANPSVEYSDDGWSRGNSNCVVRRRQPSQDANPFDAYNGLWAMRSRQTVASANARIVFSGGESDGITVIGNRTYYIKARAARGTTSQTNIRAYLRINWFNEDETIVSQPTGPTVNLTNANQWYLLSQTATAPATAVRATVEIFYERSSGANIPTGNMHWADALILSNAPIDDYFDGDTPWTSGSGYLWTGGIGSSPSYRLYNMVDEIADNNLALYSTTSNGVTRIRWNAQEDITATPSIYVGSTISLIYKGTTTTYRIVGIDGNVDPERYMIDYYLTKV
jgi:hypothetical protein